MRLEHTFTVPLEVDDAFAVLCDIERVAPCMPGATLRGAEGDEFSGEVTVKVGVMEVAYRGTARFTELDEETHRAVIRATGTQKRGAGTAQATVTSVAEGQDGTTTVTVTTDLTVTGRPAQFGRGMMDEIGNKLVTQFANCLAEELAEVETRRATAAGHAEETTEAARPADGEPDSGQGAAAGIVTDLRRVRADRQRRAVGARERPGDKPIDLLEVAGPFVVKWLMPALALVAMTGVIIWVARRRAG